ncbi:MAG: hypothetical protein H7Y15_05405, partial [Pseudonocardia sp.]|nr:hypothetical protein [Pseudonocardia sp.]
QSGTAQQSLRAPMVYRRRVAVARSIYANQAFTEATQVVMPEDGWMWLDAEVRLEAELGASGTLEPFRVFVRFQLYNSANSAVLSDPDVDHVMMVISDDTGRQRAGAADHNLREVFPVRISAGTYTLRAVFGCDTVLGGEIRTIRYSVMPVVLHSSV